jgi:hypothetical protein
MKKHCHHGSHQYEGVVPFTHSDVRKYSQAYTQCAQLKFGTSCQPELLTSPVLLCRQFIEHKSYRLICPALHHIVSDILVFT